MRTLNDLYTRLDRVIMKEMPGLYKVETIGDAYLVAANLFVPDPHHAATMAKFALRARQEAAKVPRPDLDDGSTLQMRMGEGCRGHMSAWGRGIMLRHMEVNMSAHGAPPGEGWGHRSADIGGNSGYVTLQLRDG